MDCDLQDPPEGIVELYKEVTIKNYDYVLARRVGRRDSLYRRVASYAFHKLFSIISGQKFDHRIGNFRIINRKVLVALNMLEDNIRFFAGMNTWVGFSAGVIDIPHAQRLTGKSSYSLPKLVRLSAQWSIAYSKRLISFALYMGMITCVSAVSYGVFIVYRAVFHGIAVQGWSSIMTSVFFLSGVILFFNGILGLYISAIFDEVRKRPIYIVDDDSFEGGEK
jgi:dolichol-phosphate mannosyltransferase